MREALGPTATDPTSACAPPPARSRELLGVFCETPGVYNEIIAHTVGTTYFDPDIDTIFEIGGQDAKYVYLRNRVPVDYAMNEACSRRHRLASSRSRPPATSTSTRAEEIGPIALAGHGARCKFGEHCSAFINSDIRKAIQQGASREDIVAGLVLSIVSNYLNRVVGNRRIGEHIVLQGGVAKNPAVPLAFALLLGKQIIVPPDPELMGCFGVALLALQKRAEGELDEASYDLDELIDARDRLRAGVPLQGLRQRLPHPDPQGRRAPRTTSAAAATSTRTCAASRWTRPRSCDYVEVRRQLYFEKYAPPPRTLGRARQRHGGRAARPSASTRSGRSTPTSSTRSGVEVQLVAGHRREGRGALRAQLLLPGGDRPRR